MGSFRVAAGTRNEAAELQTVLARNLDLLPGHQIDPESPRRWLLVREEMPVPDPGGAGSRWSVDLLLTDQSGVPTFVECKRYADTRSRREVVGQMLEYAANGHHYWDRAEIRRYIAETAAGAGRSVEQRFAELAPDDFRDLDELLERFVENLREGRRYILPSLFGYTEEARRAKRLVHVETGRKRRTWTEDEFMTELASTLDRAEAAAVRRISDAAREAVRLPCDFRMMGPRSDALSHRPRSFRTPQANAGRELRLTRRDFWLSPDRTKRR